MYCLRTVLYCISLQWDELGAESASHEQGPLLHYYIQKKKKNLHTPCSSSVNSWEARLSGSSWWILSLFSFTAEADNYLLIDKSMIVCCSVTQFSRIWLFVIPLTAAPQASLSFTVSQSLFKLMSIELVMPSNHPILCHSSSSQHLHTRHIYV